MRQIGSISRKERAQVFGDFLTARGLPNEVEHDVDNSWSIWIRDEDHVSEATDFLARYTSNPDAAEFLKATDEAARVRAREAEDQADYRRRVRNARSMFPQMGGYGVGVVTYGLICVCVIVFLFSNYGADNEFLGPLFISDPANGFAGFLPEVRHGEIWRLFTTMFIHFGWAHLIFNVIALFQLGSMIEARQGSGKLLVLVAVSQVLSAVAQYFLSGPNFGGMSGVVYALAGYIWMCGKHNRASGLFLDPTSMTILMIWFMACFTPLIPHVANATHAVGLAVGLIWGRVAAYFAVRRPD